MYTDNADTDDTNDNTTRQTEHDCIGSLPNEPKTPFGRPTSVPNR